MVKTKNIISILIIITLLLEISVISINYNIVSINRTRNSHVLTKVKVFSNKAYCVVREDLKTPSRTSKFKPDNSNENGVVFTGFIIKDLTNFNKPIDYRKNIRQSIPHYFNGSNYKVFTSLQTL